MEIKNISAEEEEQLRKIIMGEAHKLYKTPFAHRGRTRKGLDCAGFIWLSYRRAGIDLPDGDGKIYEPNWFWFIKSGDERYLDKLMEYFEVVDSPKLGDLVTFKCYKEMVTHAGLVDINGRFMHARSGKWVCYAELDHRYWSSPKIFHHYLRYRGFAI